MKKLSFQDLLKKSLASQGLLRQGQGNRSVETLNRPPGLLFPTNPEPIVNPLPPRDAVPEKMHCNNGVDMDQLLKQFRHIPDQISWIAGWYALDIRRCLVVFCAESTDLNSAPRVALVDSTSSYRNEVHVYYYMMRFFLNYIHKCIIGFRFVAYIMSFQDTVSKTLKYSFKPI